MALALKSFAPNSQYQDPLTKEQWDYVRQASDFIEHNLNKPGPTVYQRFKAFCCLSEDKRYVNAVLAQQYIDRTGVVERGYEAETILEHARGMRYLTIQLNKHQEFRKSVYRPNLSDKDELALLMQLNLVHDTPEDGSGDFSISEQETLPAGMKDKLEDLFIQIIFQNNSEMLKRMQKYADKNSTIDRANKVEDAIESAIDAIATGMTPNHFEEFFGTATKIIDEYATSSMKIGWANKLLESVKEYYFNGDYSNHENLQGLARRKAIMDVVVKATFDDYTPKLAPKKPAIA